MQKHLKNIEYLYGNAYVQIPNGIFQDLSNALRKDGRANIKQISFAYAYMVLNAMFYKYAHFIDLDNNTYIQNGDLKEILGYKRTTKSINKIISSGGVLEEEGFIEITKNYPVSVDYDGEEKINGITIRDFTTIDMVGEDYHGYEIIKKIIKNKNYKISKPNFLFEYKGDLGTLYNYKNTHKVLIRELFELLFHEENDNIDFLLYFYFKYKCYGLRQNMKSIAMYKIMSDIGIGKDTLVVYTKRLEERNFISVNHKEWVGGKGRKKNDIFANEYFFNIIP